ncbi:GxxExxY protein [bacterium]|nr:GxxExxY protein [bacterium]
MEQQKITEKVIGCAYRVYNRMGYGFLESVYEKCLASELHKTGMNFSQQHPITVFYNDEIVGEFVADLFVEGKVMVELKSVRRIVKSHEVQLVNYLKATKTKVGLLLNFGQEKVEVKRKVKDLNSDEQD